MQSKQKYLALTGARCFIRWASCLMLLIGSASTQAANLGVSPTLIDVHAGESVAGLRVHNGDDSEPVNVQARLVRWQQEAGADVYTPTEAVVVSPPVSRVAPGAENLIRVIRTDQTPVVGEESYRLLIDQLPDPGAEAAGTVSILIRHAVPVFFAAANATPAQAQWQIARATRTDPDASAQAGWRMTVHNSGDKRLRLANLNLQDSNDRVAGEHSGLLGYVLGHSSMTFFIAAQANTTTASALRVSAQSETGEIQTPMLPVATP